MDNKEKWIKTGYELFGEIGALALNVEKLSNLVGLNRSSFYHYFGDMEVFESALLWHHVERFKHFGLLMKDYTEFEQLFGEEIMQHKAELAFQRTLLINQSVARYKACSEDSRQYTEAKTYELWTAYNKSERDTKEAKDLFRAIRDFYYIHFGQQLKEHDTNPKDVLILLHSYFTKGK